MRIHTTIFIWLLNTTSEETQSTEPKEMDDVINEDINCLMQKIDLWERKFIERIQRIANDARRKILQLYDLSSEEFSKRNHDIVNLFHSLSTPSDDENCNLQINQLIKQIKQIQDQYWNSNVISNQNNVDWSIQEKFSKVIGCVKLDDDSLVAWHNNRDWNYEYILGQRLYFEGRHTISFKIEQCGTPYNIFLGCISAHGNQNRISVNSHLTAGWFGYNEVYHHNTCSDSSSSYGYHSNRIATKDILHLTFDCDQKQIELMHEETNKTFLLQIDVNKAKFPWQLLVILTDKDDCIRILPVSISHLNSISISD